VLALPATATGTVSLTLTFEPWKTTDCNSRKLIADDEEIARVTLITDEELEPGERRLPFALALPASAPTSYDGKLLELRWLLAASFTPHEGEPLTCQRTLTVLPGPAWSEPPPFVHLPAQLERLESLTEASPQRLGLAMLLLVFLPGLALLAFLALNPSAREDLTLVWLGVICTALGGIAAAKGLRNESAEVKLGTPQVTLAPVHARRGDEVGVQVQLTPRRPCRLEALTATLSCGERVSGNAVDSPPIQKLLLEQKCTLAQGTSLQPGHPLTFEGRLAIPSDAPFTWRGLYGSVTWTVRVEACLANWPDWRLAPLDLLVGPWSKDVSGGTFEAQSPPKGKAL